MEKKSKDFLPVSSLVFKCEMLVSKVNSINKFNLKICSHCYCFFEFYVK